MNYLEIFEQELAVNNCRWCKGCDSYNGHKRGFAIVKNRTVHYDSMITQRRTLLGGLHEIGHIVTETPKMRRYEREIMATSWAYSRMKHYRISIPRHERRL